MNTRLLAASAALASSSLASASLNKEVTDTVKSITQFADSLGWKGYQRPVETQSFRDNRIASQRAKEKRDKARKASKKARKLNR